MSIYVPDLSVEFKHCFSEDGNNVDETIKILQYISEVTKIKKSKECIVLADGMLTENFLDIFIYKDSSVRNNICYIRALDRNYDFLRWTADKYTRIFDDISREINNLNLKCSKKESDENFISVEKWTDKRNKGESVCNFAQDDTICGNRPEEKSLYCNHHIRYCPNYKIVSNKSIFIILAEWDTRKENGENLCDYSPPRGNNKGKVCSADCVYLSKQKCLNHVDNKTMIPRLRQEQQEMIERYNVPAQISPNQENQVSVVTPP